MALNFDTFLSEIVINPTQDINIISTNLIASDSKILYSLNYLNRNNGFMRLRSDLDEFFSSLSSFYDFIIYSEHDYDFVNPLISLFDPTQYII